MSTPPRRYGARELGRDRERARRAAQPAQRLAGRHHLGRAELERELALVGVLRDDGDLARVGEAAQGQRREQADRAGAAHQHARVVLDPGAQRGVDGARDRLDQDRLLVREPLGHRVQLAAVGDEGLAPAAAGVGAEAGLEAGGEVADGDPAAAVGGARGARLARLDAAGGAGQDRVDHHAGAGGQVLAVVEEVGHDLVARHERHRHDARRSSGWCARTGRRGRSRRRRRGGSAAAPSPGRSTLRLVDGHQAQGSGVAGEDPGQPVADGPPGQVAGERAVHLQRQHHRRTPAGLRGRDGGVGAGPVDDRPVLAPGMPRQRHVGAHRDRSARPRRAAAGRSGCRRSRSCSPGRCPRSAAQCRIHAARDSPTSGDAARKPVQMPRSSAARSAASMWSKSGAIGRVSGRIAPVMRTVVWPAARCSRMRRTAAGASRDRTWSVSTSSTTLSRSASRAPAYSR